MKIFLSIVLILSVAAGCKKEGDYEYFSNTWCNATRIVSIGNSITYGYGVDHPDSWPTILSKMAGIPVDNQGVSGEKSYEIRRRFSPTLNPTIIEAGRNNNWWYNDILADIDYMVTSLGHMNFFVIGLMGGDWPHEWRTDPTVYGDYGNMNYHTVIKINAELARRYPGHFLDINAYLLTKGDGSPGDMEDIDHGIPPRSVRSDQIHYNPYGNYLIADTIYKMRWGGCNKRAA